METIHIALRDEAVDVWRPVEAEREGDLYRILGPIPDGEAWEFEPGSLVRCETRELADGPALVAIAAA
jgi:hypothetical protein